MRLLAICFALATFLTVAPTPSSAGESVSVELVDGSVLRGEIVSKSDNGIVMKGSLGQQVVGRDLIKPETWTALFPVSADTDPAALVSRIRELEATVSQLRKENQSLRQQLVGQTRVSTPDPAIAQTAPIRSSSTLTGAASAEGGYWMSSTGKRHKAGCRYYGTGKGRPCGSGDGVACKTCGG